MLPIASPEPVRAATDLVKKAKGASGISSIFDHLNAQIIRRADEFEFVFKCHTNR